MLREPTQLILVEADELLVDITAFRLELLGYEVTCLRTGAEAEKRLAQDPLPKLAIIDTTLPDVNGFEFITKLNSAERTHHMPVMVLSTEADLHIVQRAYRCGAKDYLVLPYDPAVLEQKVVKLLEKVATADAERKKEEAKTAGHKKVVVPT